MLSDGLSFFWLLHTQRIDKKPLRRIATISDAVPYV